MMSIVRLTMLCTPGKPEDVKMKELKTSSVTLTLSKPKDDGGSKIDSYFILMKEDDGEFKEVAELKSYHRDYIIKDLNLPQITPRLVAVTKTKPLSDILAAYKHGQRHFGENYVLELEEKATEPVILDQCKDIKWHFIGHLQRNKASKLTTIPNLYMVETVDSQKLAQTLNNNWEKFRRPGKLKVMVQINTSGEGNKSGCDKKTANQLTTFIREKCPCLEFTGLMTIGAYGYDMADGPNPDFLNLVKCREELCKALDLGLADVELSMGMSTDYEHAIDLGSTNVRVGSTIFGARNIPQKPGPSSSGNTPQSDSSQSQPAESSQTNADSQSETRCSDLPTSSQSGSVDNSANLSENSSVNGPVERAEENNCDTNPGNITQSLQNTSLT